MADTILTASRLPLETSIRGVCPDWRYPGVAGEGVVDGGEDLASVLFRGGGVAADGVPVAGDGHRAEPAGDFLLGLRWAYVPFCLIRQAGRQLRMVRVIRRPRAGCG